MGKAAEWGRREGEEGAWREGEKRNFVRSAVGEGAVFTQKCKSGHKAREEERKRRRQQTRVMMYGLQTASWGTLALRFSLATYPANRREMHIPHRARVRPARCSIWQMPRRWRRRRRWPLCSPLPLTAWPFSRAQKFARMGAKCQVPNQRMESPSLLARPATSLVEESGSYFEVTRHNCSLHLFLSDSRVQEPVS